MTVAIVLAAIIAMYAAASLYVKKASAYLTASDAPWERMYEAAKYVIADQNMPRDAANFAAAAVMCAGCGCLTRQILLDSVLRTLGKRRKPSKRSRPDLGDAQMELMSKVVVNAIYYDSLRAPISGTILRKLVYPWLRAASEGTSPPRRNSVRDITSSSRNAISHRPEGRKLLEEACA